MQEGHVVDLPIPNNANDVNIFTAKVGEAATKTRYLIKETVCIALTTISANRE